MRISLPVLLWSVKFCHAFIYRPLFSTQQKALQHSLQRSSAGRSFQRSEKLFNTLLDETPAPNRTSIVVPKKVEEKGYQFGDFTKSLLGNSVKSITGKKEYEFGDLSRFVSNQVQTQMKNQVSNWTGKENYTFGDISKAALANLTGKETYEFGDITKSAVANFTGKETYEFGDLSKAIIGRVQSGEYTLGDVFLALRILLSAGLTVFTPVATILPARLLLDLINLGLAQELTGRLVGSLAEFLDKRMKQALTGNENYALGDITKGKLEQGITTFTGKNTYQVGDITKRVLQMQRDQGNGSNKSLSFSPDVMTALKKFDPVINIEKK